jgi:aminodeoxyfutalosine deaminase
MRKISANYLFPVDKPPVKNGIIILDDSNRIIDLVNPGSDNIEIAGVEYFNGILVPGFINTHCHLELSYLRNKITQIQDLPDFIFQFLKHRNVDKSFDFFKIAEDEMKANGIVAVGDISNTQDTFALKAESNLKYYTFIEIYTFEDNLVDNVFNKGKDLYDCYLASFPNIGSKPSVSIVPHAPYSVSEKLFKMISLENQDKQGIISIHNQENESENELYRNKTGRLIELFKSAGSNFDSFIPSGLTSMRTYLKHFSKEIQILLVHNIYTSETDADWLVANYPKTYMAICPYSNIFIEKKIADLVMLDKKGIKLTIGTDSLASNKELSILSELKLIHQNFPSLKFETILKWATLNGAEALGFDSEIGSFTIGKKPGINLVQNFDFTNMRLKENSIVTVLA